MQDYLNVENSKSAEISEVFVQNVTCNFLKMFLNCFGVKFDSRLVFGQVLISFCTPNPIIRKNSSQNCNSQTYTDTKFCSRIHDKKDSVAFLHILAQKENDAKVFFLKFTNERKLVAKTERAKFVRKVSKTFGRRLDVRICSICRLDVRICSIFKLDVRICSTFSLNFFVFAWRKLFCFI